MSAGLPPMPDLESPNASDRKPTDFGAIFATAHWLSIAGPALREWMEGSPERKADLGWLAEGIDIGAQALLKHIVERTKSDPFVELFEGELARH